MKTTLASPPSADVDLAAAARGALRRIEKIELWRGFVWYAFFFLSYLAYHHGAIDWTFGHRTFEVYKEAAQYAHTDESAFDNCADIDAVVAYMQHDMPSVVASIDDVCPQCQTGVTKTIGEAQTREYIASTHVGVTSTSSPPAVNMEFLSLTDFICADFDSEAAIASHRIA